jgi:uncharacterized protein YcbX
MAPHLARIDLYPVKSLDGITMDRAVPLASGALRGDRAWALVDGQGAFINAKREARIHQVRSRYSPDQTHITLWTAAAPTPQTFHLQRDRAALEAWFSTFFQRSVQLIHNDRLGFPDDTASPGPTVISTATVDTVATWFGLPPDAIRRRFRTNLEIDGVPAFWEDRLFSEDGSPVAFQIGAVTVQGINPCQRCVVPTRDALTGNVMPQFQQRFVQQRAASLPAGVARSPFNHFYRLAVNTRLTPSDPGQGLQVGDPVAVLPQGKA